MQKYLIDNGTLTVLKDLRQDFDLSFDQACNDLLACPENELWVDLSQATYINSTYIGFIAATFFQAKAKGKSLSLRAPEPILQILRAAGFEGFIHLESTTS